MKSKLNSYTRIKSKKNKQFNKYPSAYRNKKLSLYS